MQPRPPGGGVPFAAAVLHEFGVAPHSGQVLFQNICVVILFPQNIRHQHTGIRPAHRTVHGAHIKVRAALRRDLGKTAVFRLPVVDIVQIFFRKGKIVKEITGRSAEDLRVACPAMALPCGAVGGKVGVVVLGTPDGIFYELVKKRVGAFKKACALHVRVDRNGGEILRLKCHIRLYQHILKAEDGEGGFVVIFALPAGVDDLLQGGGDVLVGTLDVLLREFAVFVQQLAETQLDLLPGVGDYGKFRIARDVLPEVQHGLAGGGGDPLCFQPLMFRGRDIVGGRGRDGMACDLRLSLIRGGIVGVDHLAVLVVGKANGAVVAPIPAFVGGDGLHTAVCVHELQLRQQLGFCAVLIFQPPRAAGAAIPAIGQLHRQGVFAVLQQIRHIVGLVLHALAVVGNAGSEDKITNALPVQLCLVQAAGSDVQPRLFYIGGAKSLAEAVHGVTIFFVDRIIAGDPLGAPCVDAGLKGGLCPIAGIAVFVPKPHVPEHLRFRRHGCAVPSYAHGGAFHPTAVPEDAAAVIGGNDLIGGLLPTALTVPK